MTEALRIIVVAPDLAGPEAEAEAAAADRTGLTLTQAERSRTLRIGLLESGFNLIATLPADVFLAERIAQLRPDLVIVDAESDARDALEHVVIATRDAPRPIVLFTNDGDTSHMRAAVAAGVSAYVVAGLAPQRIRPILEVAQARFQREQALRAALTITRDELDATTAALERRNLELHERKVVERAKGLLMQRQGIDEAAAYARLRKTAMGKGLKLAEVAQRMLDMADLLG